MIFSTESSDWQIIHQESDSLKAELLKNELQSHDIQCFLINRKDSSYPIFGMQVLYVPKENADIAKVIVDEYLAPEND